MPSSPQEVWQSSTAPGVITINDFSPGIQRFSRGGYLPTYSANAPLGSAATAFRCYAVPGIGLCPFPTYVVAGPPPLGLLGLNSSVNGSWVGMCSIRSMGLLAAMNTETFVITAMTYDGTNTRFFLNTFTAQGTAITADTNRYISTQAGNQTFQTPNLVTYFANNTGVNILTMDPLNTTATTEKVIAWTGSGINSMNFTVPVQFFDLCKLFVQSSRIVAMTIEQFAAGNSFANYLVTDPPQQDITVPFTANKYEPSQVLAVGSWGSIDAGEAFIIGQDGGAIYITGDILAPSSVIKLPGVAPTGAVIGPAALSASGYIYISDAGVYIWNGGNTSQKISSVIPEDVLYRTAGFTFNPVPVQRPILTHHDVWGDWVMFANNWMYSTVTNSWWQVEDPAIAQMQLHVPSALSPRFFFSSQDFITNTSGGVLTIGLSVYAWDRNSPSSSYTWTSNPIPTTGGYLTTLTNVEIVASNPSATSSTIIVTPTIPAGQTAFPGNNPQDVKFTVPATTSSFRASLPLGYTDYNIQVKVDAANSNVSNEAPILHSITIGFSNPISSGVSP